MEWYIYPSLGTIISALLILCALLRWCLARCTEDKENLAPGSHQAPVPHTAGPHNPAIPLPHP